MAGTASHRAEPEPIHTAGPRTRGAHRADPPIDDPANVPLPPVEPPTKRRHRATPPATSTGKRVGAFTVGAVTGTIMLVQVGFTSTGQTQAVAADRTQQEDHPIKADAKAVLKREAPKVKTTKAPPPVVVAPPVTEVTPIVVAPPKPVAPPAAPAPVQLAPAPVAPPPPAPASSKGAAIAAAARAQIGRAQDCTMLVTNALASVGVSFHDWPVGYLSLGRQVSAAEAMPGDLIYYAQNGAAVPHIAVYIGNGRAIHGGWNGNQTIEWSVNVGYPAYAPTAYVRVA